MQLYLKKRWPAWVSNSKRQFPRMCLMPVVNLNEELCCEKIRSQFRGLITDSADLQRECAVPADRPLARAEGERVVCPAALAGWQQLHSQVGDQPTGDVAGAHLRYRRDRQRVDLGRSHGN